MGPKGDVRSVAFSPNGKMLAIGGMLDTGDWDGFVWVWDVETGRLIQPMEVAKSIPGKKGG